jgi:hypothetical protein
LVVLVMANSSVPETVVPALAAPAASAAARCWSGASARFWVCLALLVCCAIGLKTAARGFGWFFRKEAVPLKQPLQFFDARKLAPQYELNQRLTSGLERMTEDMLDSLGTHEYVQVYLTDPRKPAADPTQVALLFVTYYTGQPDMVPHVPDECWLAGGYDKVSEETLPVPVAGVGAPDNKLPVRVLEFRARRQSQLSGQGADMATVAYFFHVNGGYATTRNGVRATMLNPRLRYAYYAKVEVTFLNENSVRAGKAAAVAALGPLLERLMPVLLRDHFDLSKFPTASQAAGRGS